MLRNTEVNGETEYRTTTGKLKLRENDTVIDHFSGLGKATARCLFS